MFHGNPVPFCLDDDGGIPLQVLRELSLWEMTMRGLVDNLSPSCKKSLGQFGRNLLRAFSDDGNDGSRIVEAYEMVTVGDVLDYSVYEMLGCIVLLALM